MLQCIVVTSRATGQEIVRELIILRGPMRAVTVLALCQDTIPTQEDNHWSIPSIHVL
jgi:hypothetical protein